MSVSGKGGKGWNLLDKLKLMSIFEKSQELSSAGTQHANAAFRNAGRCPQLRHAETQRGARGHAASARSFGTRPHPRAEHARARARAGSARNLCLHARPSRHAAETRVLGTRAPGTQHACAKHARALRTETRAPKEVSSCRSSSSRTKSRSRSRPYPREADTWRDPIGALQ